MGRIYRRKGRRGWWLDYFANGERIRRPKWHNRQDDRHASSGRGGNRGGPAVDRHRRSDGARHRDQSSRPIAEHIEECLASLRVGGRSESHVNGLKRHLYRLPRMRLEEVARHHRGKSRPVDRQRNDSTQESKADERSHETELLPIRDLLCRWARRKKRILTDPLGGFARPKVRNKD